MLRFILRRGILVLPSLLGLLVITFLLIHAVPSDPAVAMAGDAATPEQIARLRTQYGLDLPIWQQFGIYLQKVAHLDFGESAFSKRPVTLDILQRLPATLTLIFFSMLISVLLGVPLGRLPRCPASPGAARRHPVAGRARHHRALHARRRARHAAAGFRLL